MPWITITPIPIFENNYVWLIRPDQDQAGVYLVDPGDADPVIAYLRAHQLFPKAILVTHRHRDHIGGLEKIIRHWPVPVYGPDSVAIPLISHKLKDGDQLLLEKLGFTVIAVPGHTSEHIAFFAPLVALPGGEAAPVLFCGDALFAGGCGRMFDGPAEVMWESLCKLATLPDTTRIYCAHEYTLANLSFAEAVEPDNRAIHDRLTLTRTLRAQGIITLPSTMEMEKRTNPFLRCHLDGVKSFITNLDPGEDCSPVQIFAALRSLKDNWPS